METLESFKVNVAASCVSGLISCALKKYHPYTFLQKRSYSKLHFNELVINIKAQKASRTSELSEY